MIAAEPGLSELAEIASCDDRVRVMAFSELYARLCQLPSALDYLLIDKAGRDFNRTTYKTRYQTRSLRVINTPDGGQSGQNRPSVGSEYLAEWARADRTRHPILLLGERGSGKTWQLFHFCQEILALHSQEPWLYGPAFYFELREEYAQLGPYGVSVPVFSQAVLREYPGVRYLWGAPLVEAFLSAGHTIICIDGFEEISQIARGKEEDAIELMRRICATLPLGTRFIIACRPSHFGSLDKLLDLQVWRGLAVRDAFEVLALTPFEDESVKTYLGSITSVSEQAAAHWLRSALEEDAEDVNRDERPFDAAVRDVLRTCSRYPALLASMVDHAARFGATKLYASDLLNAALVDAVVDYNIEMGKAQPIHYRMDGTPVVLGTRERMELLGELVWDVCERGRECLDIDSVPPHVQRLFGLDVESALIDIRTHTLLEIRMTTKEQAISIGSSDAQDSDESSLLHFAIPLADGVKSFVRNKTSMSDSASNATPPVCRAELLDATATREAPAGTTSVSGAFLLAAHIAKTFERTARVPTPTRDTHSIPFLDRMRVLGQIPLGLAAAGILREMFEQRRVSTSIPSPRALVDLAVSTIARLARRHDKSVFSSCLRYLGHNLEAMGLVSAAERQEIDPWSDDAIRAIVNGPQLLDSYTMVLVPAPSDAAVPQYLRNECIDDKAPGLGHPFLLGVREVTNDDFLTFLLSDEGENWRVENITIAGSADGKARSPFAKFANEYYLYLWEETRAPGICRHRPLDSQLSHPVGYVSWYACAAFCDWLTRAEQPGQDVYASFWEQGELTNRQVHPEGQFRGGYRLPAVREWSWAARGGRLDIAYPWELYPVALGQADLEKWLSEAAQPDSAAEVDSREWMRKWRDDYHSAVLAMPKEHIPVLMDPFTPLGTSGMMGNVKEWCHDPAGLAKDKRPILGTTSYLGERSFNYDYGMTLFPQNTNPDVGFRICRPLSQAQTHLLRGREEQLEHLTATNSKGSDMSECLETRAPANVF
jgi:formylglycine-generating enzyme required for sulfatase activity